MKQKSNLFHGTVLLTLTITTSFLLAGNGEVEYSKGNSEVIHQACKNILDMKEMGKCLNKIYPKIEVAVKVISIALKVVEGKGNNAVLKKDINLEKMERVVIRLNIKEAKQPITCNVETADIYQDNKIATLDILVSDIGKHLIIYNKDKEILVDYTITK